MTQEEKELLLRDLCARLPYGVNVLDNMGRIYKLKLGTSYFIDLFYEDGDYAEAPMRPYLRPMSSMTEEELKEFVSFTSQSMHRFICEATNTDHWYNTYEEEDWLNAHHFDYRGLIGRGLALEAPEGMYNF